MKCLVVAKSMDNPATRYRLAPVVQQLRDRGDAVTLIYEPGFFSQLRLITRAAGCDLIFIQRKLMNSIIIWLLARIATHVVFDHDDAIFLKSSGQPSSTRNVRYRTIVQESRLVLAGNEYLCQAAAAQGGQVEIVPTSVDVDHYRTVNKSEKLTLVWIGSRSTSRYLEQHREVLAFVADRMPSIRFRVVGDFQFSVAGLDVECINWSEAVESDALASAHIGIAPMIDDPWTRGKCALKIIQYMAAGLPVISSNVGANKEVVRDGETGFLVDSLGDWCAAIEKLKNSEELRSAMGSAGRKTVEEHYSQEAIAARVVSLIDNISASKISTA